MSFVEKKGWTLEPLGPTSKYWKRMAREVKAKADYEAISPLKAKHEGPIPLQDLDPNICNLKRKKGSRKHNQTLDSDKQTDGSVVVAAE
nr:hypothetical protein CFP56_04879 [Quercus suber]POE92670.1 hypothetical protein CFP56_55825 [Quercus suber]